MKLKATILVILTTAGLIACSSSSNLDYFDSRVLPDLEVPPDLTQVDVDKSFELPTAISSGGDSTEASNKIPVLANVDSIRLEGYADFYWLSVDQPPENIYQLVKNFWSSEGFTLMLDEPVIGVMQTDWVYNKEGTGDPDASFLSRFFEENELSASQDQFKTRIARDSETGASQIYISHRGTAYVHTLSTRANEDSAGNEWGFRASETELEVEMLSRLMIYLGLDQSALDEQLENIKLFAPRATLQVDYSEHESYLLLNGEYTRNWNRTLHQLERLNFEVEIADMRSGLSGDGVMLVNTDIDASVKVSSFFSLSSEVDTVKKQIFLIFEEETDTITRISMETIDGEIDNSPEGVEFLTLLYGFLK
jgi:outer membrane protein assembly factor BamC